MADAREPSEPPSSPVPSGASSTASPEAPATGASAASATDAIRSYALPTARRVVSSGLQLALASTGDLRRASIYIGLLVLGAFGPAIIALLLIVGRLGDQAGDALGAVFLGQSFGARPQPALEAALLVVAIEALIGFALFFAITIDAQVMAISILGGRAGERPLRLWESIVRARQTFWRMAGAGTLVGLVSLLIQGLLGSALGGLSQSAEATDVVAAIVATVVVAPLAYVSTSIVLGDVSAMEALSRSWRLFKARRLLAVVVVLFTLVTAAIQLFALSAGLDLVVRASEILHVSLTEGALAFTIAVVLILAAVVAYGSLTFTIGAVVAAPQVTGFLGLTFFSGGLDRARGETARPPRGFRYVSRPMAVAMLGLGAVVALQIPAIGAIPAPAASAMLALIRSEADAENGLIDVGGYPEIVEDPAGDVTGAAAADVDILRAEAAFIGPPPAWLLDRFECESPSVACGEGGDPSDFADGAYLFLERAAGPPPADGEHRVAFLFALQNEVAAFRRGGEEPYGGASRVFVARRGADRPLEARRSQGDGFSDWPTAARSMWTRNDVYLLVPDTEIPDLPLGWDAVLLVEDGSGAVASRDSLRADWEAPLHPWELNASVFIDDYRDFPG
ncbi:MAG TPA: hypothetical protein VFP56_12360 [Candidatus Limnocylindrales bacterium]|nr:hypothetical protein [Candidatus Limnocylindrales bacterium]